jgi:hypothetical protein
MIIYVCTQSEYLNVKNKFISYAIHRFILETNQSKLTRRRSMENQLRKYAIATTWPSFQWNWIYGLCRLQHGTLKKRHGRALRKVHLNNDDRMMFAP